MKNSLSQNQQAENVIDRGEFTSENDLLKLPIVDWNRLINYWDNVYDATVSISSWLIASRAHYIIAECNMKSAPKREDWPGWKHIGCHPQIGQLYWNWFHWKQVGTLHFSDSPDFHGVLNRPGMEKAQFYGDVGLVSAPTFMRSIKSLEAHDLWITIVDMETQIIIEPLGSIRQMWHNFMADRDITHNIDTRYSDR